MTINVLIGCIASGKSTYCKRHAKDGCIIINDDAIVSMIHGGNYNLYNSELKPIYKGIENNILHLAIVAGKSVIIDRGLDVKKVSRQRWISLGKTLEVPVCAIVFPMETARIHASRRMAHDNRGFGFDYWLKVAQNMSDKFEPPTTEEGFNSIVYL
jgi:predicted kinase